MSKKNQQFALKLRRRFKSHRT